MSILVEAKNRMRIPFGIAPSGNECRPVYLTFPLGPFTLTSPSPSHFEIFSFRTEIGIFFFSLFPSMCTSSCTNLLAREKMTVMAITAVDPRSERGKWVRSDALC